MHLLYFEQSSFLSSYFRFYEHLNLGGNKKYPVYSIQDPKNFNWKVLICQQWMNAANNNRIFIIFIYYVLVNFLLFENTSWWIGEWFQKRNTKLYLPWINKLLLDIEKYLFQVFEESTKKLQELSCVFAIINVGATQVSPRKLKSFRKIARSEKRIVSIESFVQMKQKGIYFKHVQELFENPEGGSSVLPSLEVLMDEGRRRSRFHGWATCDHPIDMGFLLDGSGNGKEEYSKQIGRL